MAKAAAPGLTAREREVVQLLASGMTNRDIADILCIAERTVKKHVGNILFELGARNRTEVAVMALRGKVPQ